MLFFLLKLIFFKTSPDYFYESVSFYARVKPWDIDPNMHLTNSRYLLYLDKGRALAMLQTGFIRQFMRLKMSMVVSSCNITYVREIKPLERFEIRTHFLGWDEKYFYLNQEMYVGEELRCTAMTRICPVDQKKPLAPRLMLEKMEMDIPHRPLPQLIVDWAEGLSERRNGLD